MKLTPLHAVPALIVAALLAASPAFAKSPRQEKPLISIHLNSVRIDQAIKKLGLLSGQEIVLAGSYMPEGTVSLDLNGVPLDEALRRLLTAYDYYVLHDANRRIIYVTGKVGTGSAHETQGIANAQSIGFENTGSSKQEMTALQANESIPKLKKSTAEDDPSRYTFSGPGNTVEIVPDMNKFENYDASKHQYGRLANGSLEIVPDIKQGNYANYVENKVVLGAFGKQPVVELIKTETPPKPDPGRIQTNSDGMVELLPPGIN